MARRSSGSAAAMVSLYNWVAFYGWSAMACHYRSICQPKYKQFCHPLGASTQIFGRMYVTWAILWSFPEAQSHILVTSLMLSWSITEKIMSRNIVGNFVCSPFFGMRETFGFAPSWLVWLRYNTFLVLYPIGMLSEVGLIFVAMPSMKTSGRYYLHYATTAILPLYVPGFPYLYRYMIARRKKVLSAEKIA